MRTELAFVLLLFFLIMIKSCTAPEPKNINWDAAGGNAGQTKYSALAQINKGNIHQLKIAWIYHSGNAAGNIQCNPLVIDGVMYVTTPEQHLVAVDAVNGKEKWRFRPERKGEKFSNVNRGLAYYGSGGQQIVFYGSGNYLNAVDIRTGKPVTRFGDSGRINLSEGYSRPAEQMGMQALAAPVVYKNIVIVGGTSWSAGAVVSGFDIMTGGKKWSFNTIPHPGEYGYDTWGDTSFYRTGAGVNVWGGLCVDTGRGMVFFSTGQPKGDFYRPYNAGDQLYGNCIVALDAATGKRKWHYQIIHRDLWDLDLPCAPVLVDLKQNGKNIPGVMQLSKTGNAFLFNRETGAPLSRIEERSVFPSTLEGEKAAPTQPYVSWPEPYSRQVVTAQDIFGLDTAHYKKARELYEQSDAGWFIPPSTKGLLYYGIHGGSEWGGGAYDALSNTLFVNANEIAWHIKMKDLQEGDEAKQHPGRSVFLKMNCSNCHGLDLKGRDNAPALTSLEKKYTDAPLKSLIRNGRKGMPAFLQLTDTELEALAGYLLHAQSPAVRTTSTALRYQSLGYNKFVDDQGYPCTTPPWGTLNALDLTSGKIKWKVPLGEYPELTARGIPVTGTENFGGCIVTGGGLVFIAAARDATFRAFDKDSGKVLWEAKLPFGGYAVPATYMVNGKQYVVIPATGGGKLGTPTGDTYVAFSLSDI
ncbi:MAG: PQQ-binding-like beta-propeller repeat protein [Sphingobacteriales bacterium]|nr:PQQ-binding-like beta-propeller repeat protein [Sphingobacteriales bacterium]OJY91330.1 MAG: hypothetical protein BGP14_16010 [Sphingobacteriales bacterium 44-15]